MGKEHIVIIGAGMAGSKLAHELVSLSSAPFNVTLIGEEAQVGYNRIMLSSVLSKEMNEQDIALVDVSAMSQNGANIIASDPVVSVNTDDKRVFLASGTELCYDRLVFATGARSFLPDWAQVGADNVVGFRDWNDVKALLGLPLGAKVAIVGGGLLGLEAAVGLAKNGHQPVVIQRSEYIMNRQLDRVSAQYLQNNLESRGVAFLTDTSPVQILMDQAGLSARSVVTDKGCIDVDMVVVATGITPEVQLARSAGVSVDRAILVNEKMQTSIEGVYALGECSQFEQHTFGLVAPIWDQLTVLVQTLLSEDAKFGIKPVPTKLKVSGIDLYSVGQINADPDQEITLLDSELNHYRKLVVNGDRLVGAILYGNVADGSWYAQLIQNQTNISEMLECLAFGEAYCQSVNA
ncbi:NAD(P)/FAD-dependent oxidoreductase [Marinomonas fungiae]|uniref:NAD(P)/FAD-dependent oxidoreductase n=1 Tax=Marinomonas fungiae TaxID=1137284 RepID=UPI003A93EB6E